MKASKKTLIFALSTTFVVLALVSAACYLFSTPTYAISRVTLSTESLKFLGLPDVINLPVTLSRGWDGCISIILLISAIAYFRTNPEINEPVTGAGIGIASGLFFGVIACLAFPNPVHKVLASLIACLVFTTFMSIIGGQKFRFMYISSFALMTGFVIGLINWLTIGLVAGVIISATIFAVTYIYVLIMHKPRKIIESLLDLSIKDEIAAIYNVEKN